jgi:putative membrane protein
VWQAICARMEVAFRDGHYPDGVVAGIGEISALLAQHFPRAGAIVNELPDKPIVL